MKKPTTHSLPPRSTARGAGAAEGPALSADGASAPFGEAAKNSMAKARNAYALMKTATNEATGVLQDSYKTAREGSTALALKAVEISQFNANAFFEFYKDFVGAKSAAEAQELQTAFARSQFAALAGQMNDFHELSQKTWLEMAQPGRTSFGKAFQADRPA